jgi:hypothetical protein
MEQIQKIFHLIVSFVGFLIGCFLKYFLGTDDIREPSYADSQSDVVGYILFINAIMFCIVGSDIINTTFGITEMMGLSDDYDRFGYEKLSDCDDILARHKGSLKLLVVTLIIPIIVGFIDWHKKGGLNNKKTK